MIIWPELITVYVYCLLVPNRVNRTGDWPGLRFRWQRSAWSWPRVGLSSLARRTRLPSPFPSGSGEQRSSSPSHPTRHMSKSYPLGTHKIIIIIRRRLNLYICPVVPCVVRIIISVTYVRSPLPNPAACRDRSRTYVRPGPYDYDACLYIYGHLI